MSHAKDVIAISVDQLSATPAKPDPTASKPKRDGCVCDCGDCPCNPNAKTKLPENNEQAASDEH